MGEEEKKVKDFIKILRETRYGRVGKGSEG